MPFLWCWQHLPQSWQTKIKLKKVHKDTHYNILNDEDMATLIKNLKVKGSSLVINGGTKIKNIRLVDSEYDINRTK